MEIQFYSEVPIQYGLISELYKTVYGFEIDLKYWKWRYLDNPFENKPNIAYILANNKLVCYYAVSENCFLDNEKLIRCGLMNAAMTHPDFIGRGLYAQLEMALHNKLFEEKDFHFLYGFANHNSHRIHRKVAGWKDLFILNSFSASSQNILKRKKLSKLLKFELVNAKTSDLRFINSLSYSDDKYSFIRDDKFIKWRIVDNPLNKYYFLKIFDGYQLEGLIIFKEYQRSTDIMEFFYTHEYNKLEVFEQGLVYLANKYDGIYIWSNLFSTEHLFLESLTFEEKEFNTYFGYISNGLNIKAERLHFRFVDSDVY